MSDQNYPLVSVGIPTYNRPQNLRQALKCITQQTYPNLEIIVSDNCSPTAEVEAVVREFMVNDARIKYIRQERNVGLFYNYKAVLEPAQGEYFTWAADDDYRKPEYIARCLQEFNRSEQLVLINTFSELIESKSGKLLDTDRGCTTIGSNPATRYTQYISSIFTEQAVAGSFIYGLIKMSVLLEVMDSIPVLPWDHVLLARLAFLGEFYTIPETLMYSSSGGSSKSNNSAARSLFLEGTSAEIKPWWLREIWLQKSIWDSDLSLPEKLGLSLWSYLNYLTTFGIKYSAKNWLPGIYKIYRQLRYQDN